MAQGRKEAAVQEQIMFLQKVPSRIRFGTATESAGYGIISKGEGHVRSCVTAQVSNLSHIGQGSDLVEKPVVGGRAG